MEDEDDTVIFDRAGLLTNHIKSEEEVYDGTTGNRGRCEKLCRTFCLCLAFFGLGLCIAIPGSTILDLQDQVSTDVAHISQIFTSRSVGYLIGSVLGGVLFDRFNHECLLSFSLLLTAIATAVIPLCRNFVVLTVCVAFMGLSMGSLDTGGNVLCLQIWGRSSGPYIQALHFSFGLGAFVAPLIAEPLLSKNITIEYVNTTLAPVLTSASVTENKHSIGARFVRDVGDVPTFTPSPPIPLNDGATSTMKPKKPGSANGRYLDPASEAANGSKLKTALKKQMKEASEKAITKNTQGDSVTGTGTNVSATGSTGAQMTKVSKGTSKITTLTTTSTTTTTTTTTIKPTTTSPVTHLTASPLTKLQTPAVVDAPHNNNTDSNSTSILKDIQETLTKFKAGLDVTFKKLSKVQFAYLAIAILLLTTSLIFMVAFCGGRKRLDALRNEEIRKNNIRKEPRSFRVLTLILLFFFYFCYVGIESTYSGLLVEFAVSQTHWDKKKATLLVSVFWGAFALARLLAIFFAKCLSPAVMLITDLILTIGSLIGLVMGVNSNDNILWFCTATLGLGLASIFPTGVTWAERYMEVTGKAASIFIVGSALGEMAIPALTGYFLEHNSFMWLLYILLGCSIISAVLYIIMQNLASSVGEKYGKPGFLELDSNPDHLEMNSLLDDESEREPDHNRNTNPPKKKVTFRLTNEKSSKRGRSSVKND